MSSRANRRHSLWPTTRVAWWRPVGVQRSTRAPGPSTQPPSWLTVVVADCRRLMFVPEARVSHGQHQCRAVE